MKGQIIEGAMVGLVVTIAVWLIIIIPYIFTRIHFVETINAEVVQNNAQLILLSLMSSTYQDKPIYDIMVQHVVNSQYPDISQIISPRIEKFTDCYQLQLGNEMIAQSKTCIPHTYMAQASIVLPYQPENRTISLNLTVD